MYGSKPIEMDILIALTYIKVNLLMKNIILDQLVTQCLSCVMHQREIIIITFTSTAQLEHYN